MAGTRYIIRGGVEGRERLRLIAQAMRPTTLALFERAGVRPGAACLDVGCGGGDVTLELAGLVGPEGSCLGIDIDETKLDLARAEARDRNLPNAGFRKADADGSLGEAAFDVIYARFLLTHLSDPAGCVARMRDAAKPGGLVLVEDIDFTGYFSYPESAALNRYVELYTRAVVARGGDPNIGPRLPVLLAEAGLEAVAMNVVQPAGMEREVKLLNPITMEAIADAVLAEGLADATEIDGIVAELYAFAESPRTVASTPRIVQAWGTRPA